MEQSSFKIYPGMYHTTLLTPDNKVYTCGSNCFGQLGLGLEIKPSTCIYGYGNEDNQTQFQRVDLPPIRKIFHFPYSNFVMALTTDSRIFVWGSNQNGQLGLGDTVDRSSPQETPFELPPFKKIRSTETQVFVLTTNGKVCTWDIDRPPYELDLPPVKKLFCAGGHTFVLTKDNDVFCWGSNDFGQLGLGTTKKIDTPQKLNLPVDGDQIKDIQGGLFFTMMLTITGEIYGWGHNSYGELGLGVRKSSTVIIPQKIDLSGVDKIICGSFHTMAIMSNEKVYVCGENTYGQLGLGDEKERKIFREATLPLNTQSIKCGHQNVFAIDHDNSLIYCWGRNLQGQLNLGDQKDRLSPCLMETFII